MDELNPQRRPGWADTARAVARRIAADQIPGRAAQMSFYFFLSVFPGLLVLMAALSLVLDTQALVRATLLERLAAVAPGSIVRLFTRLLEHLTGPSRAPFTWGLVVALWASSSGMVATIRGLNQAYAVVEERAWWKRRLVGFALTLALLVLLAAALLLVTYGVPMADAVARGMGLGAPWLVAWQIGQWPLVFGFVLLAFELLYHYAPHRPRVRWRWLRAGTLTAIGLWLVTSLGLKVYAANFAQYNVAYGSVGAVIVLLLWFYLTSIAILVGAEINAELEDGLEVERPAAT